MEHQQSFNRIRKSTDNSSNVANSDLVYPCIRKSNSTASYYPQSTFTAIRHKEMPASTPEIKSTSPTLLKKKEYQVDLRKKLIKFLAQQGHHKQTEIHINLY